MSRIGKKPIPVPPGVTFAHEGRSLTLRGPRGELTTVLPEGLEVLCEDNALFVKPASPAASGALWGTIRSLVANMATGVADGFEKRLELEGIGYQARLEGENLVLQVGFTHPVVFRPRPGIAFRVERNTITIAGLDKQLVGQTAAEIRRVRPPEPYKGKGIRYQGETIRRKAGKKAVSAA